ncbi:unnamed protein product [Rhodiola kirilowii]
MEGSEGDSCYSSLLGKPGTTRKEKVTISSLLVTVSHHMQPSSQQTAHGSGRSKSRSTGLSILRNLITCGAADTKESVMVLRHNCIKKSSPTNADSEICKVDKLGGSTKTSGDPWSQHLHQTSRDWRKRADNSEFPNLKPFLSRPTCSLCGKAFKPEKLYSHMKSCRGMKFLAKNAATTFEARDEASSWRSAASPERVSDDTSLLCH